MTETIEELTEAMEAAAAALDFEAARRLRDRIALLRGGADPRSAARADLSGVRRQQPGAMGLGTGQAKIVPPAGWKPPARPDLQTRGKLPKRK